MPGFAGDMMPGSFVRSGLTARSTRSSSLATPTTLASKTTNKVPGFFVVAKKRHELGHLRALEPNDCTQVPGARLQHLMLLAFTYARFAGLTR